MPKVKRTATENKRSAVRANMAKYMTYHQISFPDLAKRLNMGNRTIYKKRDSPETLTLGELWQMSDILKCPVEKLLGGESSMD